MHRTGWVKKKYLSTRHCLCLFSVLLNHMLNARVRLWLPTLLINVVTFAIHLSCKTVTWIFHFSRTIYKCAFIYQLTRAIISANIKLSHKHKQVKKYTLPPIFYHQVHKVWVQISFSKGISIDALYRQGHSIPSHILESVGQQGNMLNIRTHVNGERKIFKSQLTIVFFKKKLLTVWKNQQCLRSAIFILTC